MINIRKIKIIKNLGVNNFKRKIRMEGQFVFNFVKNKKYAIKIR